MKVIHLLSRLMGYAATAVLVLMMMLTVTDVFLRYFFNAPITGTTEITELMLVVVVFPAFAWTAVSGKHIKVDLIVDLLPPRIQKILDSITLTASLVVFIIITWRSLLEAMDVRSSTSLLSMPHAPFYWVLTIGFAMFCLAILALLIENIMKEVEDES